MKIICRNCGVEYDTNNGMYCPNCGSLHNNINNIQEQTNGFCIAGLILSFFSSLLGLIFSLIGLNKIKKTQEKGKGVAIAGLIISIVKLVSIIMVFAIIFIYAIILAAVEAEEDVTFSTLCERATYCEYDYSTDTYDCLYEDDYGDYQYITCDDVDSDVVSDSDYNYYDEYYYNYEY